MAHPYPHKYITIPATGFDYVAFRATYLAVTDCSECEGGENIDNCCLLDETELKLYFGTSRLTQEAADSLSIGYPEIDIQDSFEALSITLKSEE